MIPNGVQPRAATGYLLFSSLYALLKIGIFRYDMENEINDTIAITNDLRNNNKKEINKDNNPAKQLAEKIFGTNPQVYGWTIYTPIAKRWCTQFNENSKLICRYDEVSESNHNDIIGWSSNPEISKLFSCIIFRDHENETIYLTKRFEFMKKLYSETTANYIEIQVHGKKRLAKMIYSMYLGDFTSCYLGILRKIDPMPIPAINELKNELLII